MNSSKINISSKFTKFLLIVILAVALGLYISIYGRSSSSSKYKPNFVIILADNQGYGDLSCYGAEGFSTPNIDSMASEGVLFTDFYAAPSCTPSRAALLTGCYGNRVGLPSVLRPAGPPNVGEESKIGLNPKETTIAEILKREGYSTICIGKWHLGHHPEFLPTNHGFDEYFGIPYSLDMNPKTHPLFPPLPLIESKSGDSISPPDTFRIGPEISKLTTWYTERAIKFIKENRDRPFLLYLPHSMPHIPLGVSEKFRGKSDIGIYGDVMMEIDWSVGQILKTLKKVGVDDKTLVIFTSDNGPMLAWGNHGGSPGSLLRGGMGSTFEGGVRVPCIMRWPGKIPPGTVCTEVATLMDLLPTFAKLVDSELPENKIDGKDIWSLMEGKPGAKSPHSVFFYYRGRELRAVRSGKWKLHVPHEYRYVKEVGNGGEMGVYGYSKIDTSLFNLKVMGERHDVSKHHPKVVKRLLKLIEEMRRELGDSYTEIRGENRRLPGKIGP